MNKRLVEGGIDYMDITLDILEGEGIFESKVRKRVRRECDICSEVAHYKHTFLLRGTRNNPSSKAYRKDDCSWCEDESAFSCKDHQEKTKTPPEGYVWCSTFPASQRFAHMFLYWEEADKDELYSELYNDCLQMALRLYGEDYNTFAPETMAVMDKWKPRVDKILDTPP